jgi:hypothetical protein
MPTGPGLEEIKEDGFVTVQPGSRVCVTCADGTQKDISGTMKVKQGDTLYWTADCDYKFKPEVRS